MAGGAKVENLEALQFFRVALVKFAEEATAALGDADGEQQRMLMWLETEQASYWQGQLRERADQVAKAKEAVRAKTLYKGIGGRVQSAVDEKKALAIAIRRVDEAEQKLLAVKRWVPRLKKEIFNYHSSVQRLATDVASDVPLAVAQLSNMIVALEAYLALQAAGPDVAAGEQQVEGEPPTKDEEGNAGESGTDTGTG